MSSEFLPKTVSSKIETPSTQSIEDIVVSLTPTLANQFGQLNNLFINLANLSNMSVNVLHLLPVGDKLVPLVLLEDGRIQQFAEYTIIDENGLEHTTYVGHVPVEGVSKFSQGVSVETMNLPGSTSTSVTAYISGKIRDVGRLKSVSNDQKIVMTEEDELVHGNSGDDTMIGSGSDALRGGQGDDILISGDDDSVLHGNKGEDSIFGGEGNNTIHGGQDGDILTGGFGNDELHGDKGDDTLIGVQGSDTLTGGSGIDEIIVTHLGGPLEEVPTITDFNLEEDKIVFTFKTFFNLEEQIGLISDGAGNTLVVNKITGGYIAHVLGLNPEQLSWDNFGITGPEGINISGANLL